MTSDSPYYDRLARQFEADRLKILTGLVGALRRIPRDLREQEAAAAIKRLEKQERLEIKIKSLSEEDIDVLLSTSTMRQDHSED